MTQGFMIKVWIHARSSRDVGGDDDVSPLQTSSPLAYADGLITGAKYTCLHYKDKNCCMIRLIRGTQCHPAPQKQKVEWWLPGAGERGVEHESILQMCYPTA